MPPRDQEVHGHRMMSRENNLEPSFERGILEPTQKRLDLADREKVARLVADLVTGRNDSKDLPAKVSELAHQPRRMKFCFD